MKKCDHCGFENDDDEACCSECGGTGFSSAIAPAKTESKPTQIETDDEQSPAEPTQPEYEFSPLTPADRQKDLVTLVTCRSLVAADFVVSRLAAAGIEAFIPDKSVMQWTGWNFNTYGYVRVQIAPKDYEAAKDLIAG